jgi:hypothetical protein
LGGIVIPLILIPLLFQSYINPSKENKMQLEKDIYLLSKLTEELFYRDEETFLFCSENKHPIENSQYYSELMQVNRRRDQLFEKLVNYTLELYHKKKINAQAYSRMKPFAQWNNTLYLAHKNVCNTPLKNPTDLDNWRNQLNQELLSLLD